MSQTNNGNNVLEKYESLLKKIEDYDKRCGLFVNIGESTKSEAQKLLEISPERLKKLSREEKEDGAFILQQMAFFLQRTINHEAAVIKWAEEAINRMISPRIRELNRVYFSPEERRFAAINESESTKKLHDIIVERKIRVEQLSFVINRVENLSKTLISRRSNG